MLACLRQASCRTFGSGVLVAELLSTQLASQAAAARTSEIAAEVPSAPCPSGRSLPFCNGKQQRRFFDLMGLNGDLSKNYQERKLIGCALPETLQASVLQLVSSFQDAKQQSLLRTAQSKSSFPLFVQLFPKADV